MSDCPSCYGEWSKTRTTCKACEFRVWCEESSQIDKGLGCFSYDDVSYSQTIAQEPDQWNDRRAASAPHKMLAELLYDLHERPAEHAALIKVLNRLTSLHNSSPRGFSVTLTKVLNPGLSYTEIGERHGITKQSVAFHLGRAQKLIPQLKAAILVDRRNLPKSQLAKSLTLGDKSKQDNKINCKLGCWIEEKYGSLAEFSRKTKIPLCSLCRWLNGDNRPRHKSRERLADAVGVTMNELEEKFGL